MSGVSRARRDGLEQRDFISDAGELSEAGSEGEVERTLYSSQKSEYLGGFQLDTPQDSLAQPKTTKVKKRPRIA